MRQLLLARSMAAWLRYATHPAATLPVNLPTPPPPVLQRKRLEPFEVPKSGDFWLHDDRFDPGEGGEAGAGGMRSDAAEPEQDERQR